MLRLNVSADLVAKAKGLGVEVVGQSLSLNQVKILEAAGELHQEDLRGLEYPTSAPPSEALKKRREYLQARHENRVYKGMVANVAPHQRVKSLSPEHTGEGGVGFRQSAGGLNMVIGAIASFVSVTYEGHPILTFQVGAQYLGAQMGWTDSITMVVSAAAMIITLLLELVLFIIRATRFDRMDVLRNKKHAKEGVFGVGVDAKEQYVGGEVLDSGGETKSPLEKKLQ